MSDIDATSAVMFAAGSVVIALVLCTALRRHKLNDPGIRWLIASNCALLLAAVGVLSGPALGFVFSAMLVIGGAYVGICSAWFAVLRAEGKSVPWRLVLGFGLLAVTAQGWLAAQYQNVNVLMLSSSTVNSVLIAFITWRVWKLIRPHTPRLASLMCMPFALLLAGYALRIPVVLTWPEGPAPIMATMLIIVAMAWASVILELAMIALRETHIQEQLREALTKAEDATRARTRFLLDISHDLRTPLNAILGLSELMRHETLGPLPAKYAEQAKHIHAHGLDLHELINDLLMHTSGDGDEDSATAKMLDRAIDAKFSNGDTSGPVQRLRQASGS